MFVKGLCGVVTVFCGVLTDNVCKSTVMVFATVCLLCGIATAMCGGSKSTVTEPVFCGVCNSTVWCL